MAFFEQTIDYKQINGRSPVVITLLCIFGALIFGGLYATYRMYVDGIHLSGMTNRVPWGLQIVMGVYHIGLSEGSLLVSGLYGIFGKLEYKPFARITAYLAMLFLIAGLLSIVTDQGRIDRVFVKPFVYFNGTSMFSLNPILYVGLILICLVYLWALFKERGRLTKLMSVAVVLWALGVHTGTGYIFAFVARELYHSPLLPITFVAAANSSGVALMIILIVLLFKVTRRALDPVLIIWLGRMLAVFVVVTMYVLLVDNIHRLYILETREAAHEFLFGGIFSVMFWGGLILIGLLTPAIILFRRNSSKSVPWIVFACCLVVFGVFFERYLIVIPGQVHPPNLFPGMEITGSVLEEGIVTYKIKFLEVLQALGVLGIVGFAFVVGLSRLRMLPIEARCDADSPMLRYQMPDLEWNSKVAISKPK